MVKVVLLCLMRFRGFLNGCDGINLL